MQPHIRAIVAASAHALVTGKKVAGLYDHQADRHLRIAAEARGEHLQGFDGDRNAKFGGTLPELQDTGAGTSIHMEIVEGEARGYDRSSAGHFTTRVTEQRVQLFDHAEGAWFTFEVEIAP
ncbi:hypothetical protein [Sphingomonas sanguinis]|uniref:Uncharacterized protein n=1 Tax=Sphingomonas sanguinis TaxID=33051 RepID=A0A147JCE9_9SPHN|nr:hypothetical protein [Sphingomonas sanguinis]KTW17323.1 hypothetical protein NS258_02265 [Sphingomonas sanguinis]